MTIPQQFHPNPPGLLMRIACSPHNPSIQWVTINIGGRETLTRSPQWGRGGGG